MAENLNKILDILLNMYPENDFIKQQRSQMYRGWPPSFSSILSPDAPAFYAQNLRRAIVFFGRVGTLLNLDIERSQEDFKSMDILRSALTSEQCERFRDAGYFEVLGSDNRKYKIFKASHSYNVFDGEFSYCAYPPAPWNNPLLRREEFRGNFHIPLPLGDVLLAQKLAIETNAEAYRQIANVGYGPYHKEQARFFVYDIFRYLQAITPELKVSLPDDRQRILDIFYTYSDQSNNFVPTREVIDSLLLSFMTKAPHPFIYDRDIMRYQVLGYGEAIQPIVQRID